MNTAPAYRFPRTNEKERPPKRAPFRSPCPVGALTRTVRKFQNCGLGDNSVTRYSKLAPGDRLIEVTWELTRRFSIEGGLQASALPPKVWVPTYPCTLLRCPRSCYVVLVAVD